MEQYATGAKRSERVRNHFHLLPSQALRRVSQRYAMAVPKGYGEYNWLKGFPFSDLFNHVQEHLENAKQQYEHAILTFQGDEDAIIKHLQDSLGSEQALLNLSGGEDDLAGAAFGIFCIMELARLGRLIPDEGWHVANAVNEAAPEDPRVTRIRELERQLSVMTETVDVSAKLARVSHRLAKRKPRSRR